MAVTRDDVLHVAQLARLGIDSGRVDSLVAELNGILTHMETLQAVETGGRTGDGGQATGETETPLRADEASPIPLATARESFSPAMREGFFLVPRLATHEDQGDRAP